MKLSEAALQRLARGYLSAAKANLDYYDSLMLAGSADSAGASLARAQAAKAAQSGDYRIANLLLHFSIGHMEEKGVPGAMASLAASLGSYLRSASLIASEYSLGVVTVKGTITSIEREKAFASMLELAELKAREQAAVAKAVTGRVPMGAQVKYLEARVLREGDTAEKLDALYAFWQSSGFSQIAVLLTRGAAP
ncbi:MAG: hypothetical protein ACYC8T_36335 [Myxococcaceae bacterium]